LLISNISQLIFETSLAYSIELTYRPTQLDLLNDPENQEDD